MLELLRPRPATEAPSNIACDIIRITASLRRPELNSSLMIFSMPASRTCKSGLILMMTPPYVRGRDMLGRTSRLLLPQSWSYSRRARELCLSLSALGPVLTAFAVQMPVHVPQEIETRTKRGQLRGRGHSVLIPRITFHAGIPPAEVPTQIAVQCLRADLQQ